MKGARCRPDQQRAKRSGKVAAAQLRQALVAAAARDNRYKP
jgi:hypothetical protein